MPQYTASRRTREHTFTRRATTRGAARHRNATERSASSVNEGYAKQWVMGHGSWVMGQMGQQTWMDHVGHGQVVCYITLFLLKMDVKLQLTN